MDSVSSYAKFFSKEQKSSIGSCDLCHESWNFHNLNACPVTNPLNKTPKQKSEKNLEIIKKEQELINDQIKNLEQKLLGEQLKVSEQKFDKFLDKLDNLENSKEKFDKILDRLDKLERSKEKFDKILDRLDKIIK